MDAFDLFKQLSAGAKFDKKRFKKDTECFQYGKKLEKNVDLSRVKIEAIEEISQPEKQKASGEGPENDSDTDTPKNQGLTLLSGVSMGKGKPSKKKKLATEEKELQQQQEKINQFRNSHKISVVGRRIPAPIASFDELRVHGVGGDLLENLNKSGYKEPTAIQMQALPILLEGRELLACAPTGSGKTAAFLLPIIHHLEGPRKQGFRGIILSPTRELAKQTYRECTRLSEGRGFRIHIISKIKQALDKYGPKSSQKFDILITTPKRLIYLLNQEPPAINLSNVEFLVVDEADKLFEDGTRSFRGQLEIITRACTNEKLQRAMFSATNTPAVTKWCRHNLRGLINVTVGHRNAATELVEQELLFVGSERGKLVAFRNIVAGGISPPVLVFVQSKERAQELFNELIYDGINVDVIHADRTQTQRDNVVRCFREGKIWVLVCTELMSRGIDFKGVNLVINYDFPPSAISYIHRIGRTGRAGHRGKAITFFTESDTANLRSIAAIMRDSGCQVPDYMLTMKKHSKRERKQMEIAAPKRDSISTIPKFKRRGNVSEKSTNSRDKKPPKISKVTKSKDKKSVPRLTEKSSKAVHKPKQTRAVKKTGAKQRKPQ
ncbi:probable ATP-dependent RNA helicase DDX52 [Fopius arisanus]|uniref:Probable ATP-dependent RNA helicase DDX52 n=1 Tax=Fopius arisanus TaxID=64838 RepID=A0A9R1SU90_9HYME|nr:PREDICTED: probable ATP-dependent RNA helicase DDX52 [Fopius arisanus]